jgi:hypothetical protein
MALLHSCAAVYVINKVMISGNRGERGDGEFESLQSETSCQYITTTCCSTFPQTRK